MSRVVCGFKSMGTLEYLIEQILTPMTETEVRRISGKNSKTVVLLMDTATALAAGRTVKWLEESNVFRE